MFLWPFKIAHECFNYSHHISRFTVYECENACTPTCTSHAKVINWCVNLTVEKHVFSSLCVKRENQYEYHHHHHQYVRMYFSKWTSCWIFYRSTLRLHTQNVYRNCIRKGEKVQYCKMLAFRQPAWCFIVESHRYNCSFEVVYVLSMIANCSMQGDITR